MSWSCKHLGIEVTDFMKPSLKGLSKLTAKVIDTFYGFLSFFDPQQYPQTYHDYFYSPRFDIYLSGCAHLLIKI